MVVDSPPRSGAGVRTAGKLRPPSSSPPQAFTALLPLFSPLSLPSSVLVLVLGVGQPVLAVAAGPPHGRVDLAPCLPTAAQAELDIVHSYNPGRGQPASHGCGLAASPRHTPTPASHGCGLAASPRHTPTPAMAATWADPAPLATGHGCGCDPCGSHPCRPCQPGRPHGPWRSTNTSGPPPRPHRFAGPGVTPGKFLQLNYLLIHSLKK
jgi:hypothetical protein